MWAAPLGRPNIFVWPLGRTVLYNLPFWIKISAQNRTRNHSDGSRCRVGGDWGRRVEGESMGVR